jgi:hypothetical protein
MSLIFLAVLFLDRVDLLTKYGGKLMQVTASNQSRLAVFFFQVLI